MNELDLKRLFPNASASTIARNKAGGVAQTPVAQRGDPVQPVATDAPKGNVSVRCLVRIKVFCLQLLDGDNFYPKDAVDALRHAGILVDDTEAWCKVETSQEQCGRKCDERTEITVTPIVTTSGKTARTCAA